MKSVIKRYLSLMAMMLLLVLVVSWLPKNGSVDSSDKSKQSTESAKVVGYSAIETRHN